ncbi:MAG: hypothetical protein U0835_10985 [Isosphaeraceae bacterium]
MSTTTRLHPMTNHARSARQVFSFSGFGRRPAAVAALGLAAAAVLLLVTPARPARALSWQVPQPGGLVVMERTLLQDQGAWVVNYRLKYQGNSGIVVTPTEILARLEGWVSNSRVAAHAVPRLSSVVVSGASGLSGAGEVVSTADESLRCREKATLQVWTDDPTAEGEDAPAPPAATSNTNPNAALNGAAERQPILSLAPGASVRVRMRLDHMHYLYGDYDPLLGVRSLELTLGAATMRDVLPLDVEQYLAQPKYSWPAPPEDRRDDKFFLSAPDSLHLEAHVTGNQYYRFPERPVRYGTLMRLRFAYFIAAGTEGECRVQIAQYKDTPTSWKALSDGMYSQCLNKVGRWVRVERVFRTEPEANLLALDFKISSIEEVGEMWIDDVSLEPVAPAPPSRP